KSERLASASAETLPISQRRRAASIAQFPITAAVSILASTSPSGSPVRLSPTLPRMTRRSRRKQRRKCSRPLSDQPGVAIYVYPGVAAGFDRAGKPNYDKQAAGLAHSRSIALLRQAMGPHYDLEALWGAGDIVHPLLQSPGSQRVLSC